MTDFSSALVTRVASLRDNPQYSDLEIITPTRSFHAHKIILSARSSDWGRGVDLSTSVVLDWKAFSDQTCEDILDYIYLDEVKCLVDKTYDDVRVIELLSCASFFSLDELVSRCEIFLEESKARYPLEPHSPAVLMTVALQASSKNQKRPLITITESKEGLLYDVQHDHCYIDPPPPRKKRKLRVIAGPRNNNVASASNTRAEAAGKEDDLLQVDTGEVENNNNEDYEKRGGSVSVVTSIVDTILDRMYKYTEQDMRKHGVAPNKETYQCLISRNCQDGDIEGASKVLKLMKNQGIKINEDMFNSLILGHGEAGDLLKVMQQWGLSPSLETFLNLILACGYSKAEDWKFMEKEMAKEMAEDEDQVYSANDYMELMLMLMLSLCRHKEDTAQLLALSIPETEI